MLARARPPSPELTNLDCAFPPFPTKKSRSNTPLSDSRSQTSDNDSSYVRAHTEAYNAPSRRGSISSSGARKRSKTLAGSQDAAQIPATAERSRRPSLATVTAGARPGFQNAPPLPSPLNFVASGPLPSSKTSNGLTPSSDQPNNLLSQGAEGRFQSSSSTANVSQSGDMGLDASDRKPDKQHAPVVGIKKEVKIPTDADDSKKPSNVIQPTQVPSEPVRENDPPSYRIRRPPPIANTWLKEPDNGRVTPFENPQGSPSRSQTFPLRTDTAASPEYPDKVAQRRPSEPSAMPQSLWPLDRSSHISSEKSQSQSPLPSTMSFSGGLHHSPSDSASSYGSVNSVERTLSSRSSQPLHDTEPEKAADTTSRHDPPEGQQPEIMTPPKLPPVDYEVDSPTDPAFQNGRLTPVEPLELYRTQSTPESSPAPSPQPPATTPDDVERNRKRDPLLRSKTNQSNKGPCRGCSKIIAANQKSVSSADGRLTGRYHKECFACTTCHNAFQTTDFYVLQDQPYCAQHYHALNGSLCGSCGRGIEGQYLEATRSEAKGPEKFHAKCFTCVMCRVVLKHDYFAHHGRFFCEQDIRRVAGPSNRSPNGRGPANGAGLGANSYLSPHSSMARGKFPERRSTKLMIMS